MCSSLLEASEEEKRLEEGRDLEVAIAIRHRPVEVPNDVRPLTFKYLKKTISPSEAREIEAMVREITAKQKAAAEAKVMEDMLREGDLEKKAKELGTWPKWIGEVSTEAPSEAQSETEGQRLRARAMRNIVERCAQRSEQCAAHLHHLEKRAMGKEYLGHELIRQLEAWFRSSSWGRSCRGHWGYLLKGGHDLATRLRRQLVTYYGGLRAQSESGEDFR